MLSGFDMGAACIMASRMNLCRFFKQQPHASIQDIQYEVLGESISILLDGTR
jgi:hypothetical protein